MYFAYFSRPKTDPFGGNYAAVLDPYRVDPLNAANVPTPASVTQQIYAASPGVACHRRKAVGSPCCLTA